MPGGLAGLATISLHCAQGASACAMEKLRTYDTCERYSYGLHGAGDLAVRRDNFPLQFSGPKSRDPQSFRRCHRKEVCDEHALRVREQACQREGDVNFPIKAVMQCSQRSSAWNGSYVSPFDTHYVEQLYQNAILCNMNNCGLASGPGRMNAQLPIPCGIGDEPCTRRTPMDILLSYSDVKEMLTGSPCAHSMQKRPSKSHIYHTRPGRSKICTCSPPSK